MSYYTSFGISVSPEVSGQFLGMIFGLDYKPDHLNRTEDGTVTAVWEAINHFDESAVKENIDRFIGTVDWSDYCWESIDEDGERELEGGYFLNFGTRLVYEVYGEPVRIESRSGKGRVRIPVMRLKSWRRTDA